MSQTESPVQAAVAAIGEPMYVLAAEVRIGPSDFGRIVQGRQAPTSAQASRIAKRLGSTPETLFPSAAPQ